MYGGILLCFVVTIYLWLFGDIKHVDFARMQHVAGFMAVNYYKYCPSDLFVETLKCTQIKFVALIRRVEWMPLCILFYTRETQLDLSIDD